MPSGDRMAPRSYADSFWGEEMTSTAGVDALVKRNKDSKKTCAELEEYLKKRSKVEADYSKALSELSKCFKDKNELGVMEATLTKMRQELDSRADQHEKAATFFQQRSEAVKKFKEEQTNKRKMQEESVNKVQRNKLSQWTKTKQAEKVYVNKSVERDSAEKAYKGISNQQIPAKDIDKARNKMTKAIEDASKADSNYQSAVLVLEDCRVQWEKEMLTTCQMIQKLDEERLAFLREEIWTVVNEDSRLALETDQSCEQVREVLEKCDIISDIQAFIDAFGTGEDHPEKYEFRHYQTCFSEPDTDSNHSNNSDPFNPYSLAEEVDDSENGGSASTPNFATLKKLNFPKMLKKAKASSSS